MNLTISLATTEQTIARCFPVMRQLRPHVAESEFVARVLRQQAGGYHLACVEAESSIRAVAGYRFFDTLAWGRICYVDDLITDEHHRSQGHGRALLEWLLARAREARCEEFHLDSGVQRHAAHRFYLAHRLNISSHHFSMKLG